MSKGREENIDRILNDYLQHHRLESGQPEKNDGIIKNIPTVI